MKKSHQFTVRLPVELREQIEAACTLTGLDAATVTRACLEAFVEEVERTGEIRLPLAVVPKSKREPSFPPAPSGTRSTPSLNDPAAETRAGAGRERLPRIPRNKTSPPSKK